jgi:hypothetical protein
LLHQLHFLATKTFFFSYISTDVWLSSYLKQKLCHCQFIVDTHTSQLILISSSMNLCLAKK